MFRSEEELVDVLVKRKNQTYGIDMLKMAMKELNHPDKGLKIIQIGGTNGKGSTVNFSRAILQNANYRVGTFTSPHLVHHRDRIRINDVDIPKSDFLEYANRTYYLWDKYQLSMFEIDLIIALLYFVDQQVDVAIFEVGLGGRLDATNVLLPKVIGITNVGLDHLNILGETVEEITKEKAGIFKSDVPVFTSSIDPVVNRVLNDNKKGPITYIKEPRTLKTKQGYRVSGEVFDFDLNNHAEYQAENANLATVLVKSIFPKISDDVIKDALRYEVWAGRFEQVSDRMYLDGAHNELGIKALIKEMNNHPKPHIVLFAALQDKDTSMMIDLLEESSDALYISEFDFPRAARIKELLDGRCLTCFKRYEDALNFLEDKHSDGTVFITGSLYFISLVRETIKKA